MSNFYGRMLGSFWLWIMKFVTQNTVSKAWAKRGAILIIGIPKHALNITIYSMFWSCTFWGPGPWKEHCTNIGSYVPFEVPIYGNSGTVLFRVLDLQGNMISSIIMTSHWKPSKPPNSPRKKHWNSEMPTGNYWNRVLPPPCSNALFRADNMSWDTSPLKNTRHHATPGCCWKEAEVQFIGTSRQKNTGGGDHQLTHCFGDWKVFNKKQLLQKQSPDVFLNHGPGQVQIG